MLHQTDTLSVYYTLVNYLALFMNENYRVASYFLQVNSA